MSRDRFTLKELILMAMLAVMGMVLKPFLSPLFNLLTDFIRIPGGSAVAGISELFLVAAAALIGKKGTALITGLLQGLISLTTGISAAAGVLVLITYSLPGPGRCRIDQCAVFQAAGDTVYPVLCHRYPFGRGRRMACLSDRSPAARICKGRHREKQDIRKEY